MTTPLVIAHRGASGYRPEHSRGAYELAIVQGAGAVEPDVVASKDGVLVVRHENNLAGSTDVASRVEFASRYTAKLVDGVAENGWFTEDFTWEELRTLCCREPQPTLRPGNVAFEGEPIMRLADVLGLIDIAGGETKVVVELKHATYFDDLGLALDDALERELSLAGWSLRDPRMVVESFELTILKRMRSRGIGATHIYLLDESGTAVDQVRELGENAPTFEAQRRLDRLSALAMSCDGMSLPASLVVGTDGAALVERAHECGLTVFAWTLRPENKFLPLSYRSGFDPRAWGNWQSFFREVIATGVDGVFADHPDLVVGAS